MERVYVCIDLKSFYASVECVERNLDPLNTNLVVADENRTDKTICLAATPSIKQYGIKGRSRLYEVRQKIKKVNYERRKKNNYRLFTNKSIFDSEIKNDRSLEVDFIIAKPRMRLYMEYSSNIYNIYLKYLSSDDILVYSIDEVFLDITSYLTYYSLTKEELVMKIIEDIYKTTGLTATAGIGTNMYLAKVAMDITAKKMMPNEYGVRMAYLDEDMYKEKLWNHRPLTDFWRVGKGYSKKLEENNMFTMGDVARKSLENEDLLFKLFGVNAEFLIDHAWGYEPCSIKDVKEYTPSLKTISIGQVLHCSYDYEKTKVIIKEMMDTLSLSLVDKDLKTNKIVLTINYDIENLCNDKISSKYTGAIIIDMYGRKVPKYSHGTRNIDHYTSSSKLLMEEGIKLYEKIVNPILLIKKITVGANVKRKSDVLNEMRVEQIDLFGDYENRKLLRNEEMKREDDEEKVQKTILNIKDKYGKNSILRGINFSDVSTAREKNNEVGGHSG